MVSDFICIVPRLKFFGGHQVNQLNGRLQFSAVDCGIGSTSLTSMNTIGGKMTQDPISLVAISDLRLN